ncbi:MAG: Gfo/Idh/MocA family oxidoreductase [Clostridium sp.]|uniref:Gfo/Idh/MocA family protein n=1 Tax=Clostridium sp. TaxID=1506 RepID=UPI0025C40ED0|nr:Gfo/Idh/MocA family oxidoreductase [Clostridium sp.]MBS4959046.1 Gfo/Idh/MocA family oxidoreductase [Clostridium sp.]MDU2157641.1 Gfo/Idh/MocA family oxidoreductase [Clostridium sp.]
MKIVVIGLGSMGKRRLKLLKGEYKDIDIIGVDLDRKRRESVEENFGINTYDSLELAVNEERPDAAVISTSPLSHSNIILKCLDLGLHVFTEINLVKDKYEEIINKAKEKKLEIFLSSTQLYREEIKEIESRLSACTQRVNYIYHIGQYLPDWHPWESYKDFFVSDKRTNGCRELFAIELPWIFKIFGKLKDITVKKDKISKLDLEYNDSYLCILEHENGNKGIVCIDVVSRKAISNLEVYGEEIYLTWEGTPDSLKVMNLESKMIENINTYNDVKKDDKYAENIIENPYLEELKTYINKINGINNVRYTFEDDLYTLSIVDKIEEEV